MSAPRPRHRAAALLSLVAIVIGGGCASPVSPRPSAASPTVLPSSPLSPPVTSEGSPAAQVPLGEVYRYADGITVQLTAISHRVLTASDNFDQEIAKEGDDWTVVTFTLTNGTSDPWPSGVLSNLRYGPDKTMASHVALMAENPILAPGQGWEYFEGYVVRPADRGDVSVEFTIDAAHRAIAFNGSIVKERG